MAGTFVYYLVRSGRLKPNVRFGAAPKVFTSSFVAYWIGKISYILSDSCQDKFLKGASNSEIAYHIRKQRGLAQPWTAIRDFGSKETSDKSSVSTNTYSGDSEQDSEAHGIQVQIPAGDTAFDVIKSKNLVVSKREEEILKDCNNCAFYFFSLPLCILCGGFMFGAKKKGWITDWSDKKWISKLPKFPFRNRTLHGITVGYLLGQIIYLNTSDCTERFLSEAPDGEVAKYLRQQMDELFEGNDGGDSFLNHTNQVKWHKGSHDDYLDKLMQIDPDSHEYYIADHRDINFLNWLEESKIDIPDKFKK